MLFLSSTGLVCQFKRFTPSPLKITSGGGTKRRIGRISKTVTAKRQHNPNTQLINFAYYYYIIIIMIKGDRGGGIFLLSFVALCQISFSILQEI